jgi:hypothetical protein
MSKRKKQIQPIRMQPDYSEGNINDRLDELRKKQAIELLKIAKELIAYDNQVFPPPRDLPEDCNYSMNEMMEKMRTGSSAEKEMEKLLKAVLKNSKWKNKVFSVGGYERDKLLNVDSKDLDLVVEKKGGGKGFSLFLHSLFPKESSRPYEMGA